MYFFYVSSVLNFYKLFLLNLIEDQLFLIDSVLYNRDIITDK